MNEIRRVYESIQCPSTLLSVVYFRSVLSGLSIGTAGLRWIYPPPALAISIIRQVQKLRVLLCI